MSSGLRAVALFGLLAGCGPGEGLELTCEDLGPAEQASFRPLAALVTEPGARSCAACHNTASPVRGLNLEGPAVTWDAFTSKPDLVYAQLASGAMPEDGVAWSDEELRSFRTWYCNGAIYDVE